MEGNRNNGGDPPDPGRQRKRKRRVPLSNEVEFLFSLTSLGPEICKTPSWVGGCCRTREQSSWIVVTKVFNYSTSRSVVVFGCPLPGFVVFGDTKRGQTLFVRKKPVYLFASSLFPVRFLLHLCTLQTYSCYFVWIEPIGNEVRRRLFFHTSVSTILFGIWLLAGFETRNVSVNTLLLGNVLRHSNKASSCLIFALPK